MKMLRHIRDQKLTESGMRIFLLHKTAQGKNIEEKKERSWKYKKRLRKNIAEILLPCDGKK